ncbi:LysM peptidoglycan-binding domain-containing protein [Termitidicoccus mucosus]
MIAAILGGLAVLLAAIALFKLSSVSKQLAKVEGATTRIESIESQVSQASAAASDAANLRNYVAQMERQIQQNFTNVRNEFNTVRTEINTVKESTARRPAPQGSATAGGQGQSATPPVAGPDEYVVQSGDTGVKIARSNGVNLNDLIAVNPDINWNRLRVGQKVKIPKK